MWNAIERWRSRIPTPPKQNTDQKTGPPQRDAKGRVSGGNPGNSGGKKGRSGRKPQAFLALCRASRTDPTLWAEAREKNPVAVLQLAAEYTQSKAAQKMDATVIFKAVRE